MEPIFNYRLIGIARTKRMIGFSWVLVFPYEFWRSRFFRDLETALICLDEVIERFPGAEVVNINEYLEMLFNETDCGEA